MVDNMELLRMIMENNPGQSPAFILEQYALYQAGLRKINGESCSDHADDQQPKKPDSDVVMAKVSITAGYTKRHLKVKPDVAILEDKIFCCICGKEAQTLTERHLATHNGLTREGYLKLCGYKPDQPLMSLGHLVRMRANVAKAQQARSGISEVVPTPPKPERKQPERKRVESAPEAPSVQPA